MIFVGRQERALFEEALAEGAAGAMVSKQPGFYVS
jgi:hypothetical protein